jgi:hypothetical protein
MTRYVGLSIAAMTAVPLAALAFAVGRADASNSDAPQQTAGAPAAIAVLANNAPTSNPNPPATQPGPPAARSSGVADPQGPVVVLSEKDMRSASKALQDKEIACKLLSNAEVAQAGVHTPGSGGGAECGWGAGEDQKSGGGPSARLGLYVASSERVQTMIKYAEAHGVTVTATSVNGVVVTTMRSQRTDCAGVAQRADGTVVVFTITRSGNDPKACDDARQLTARAMTRVPAT